MVMSQGLKYLKSVQSVLQRKSSSPHGQEKVQRPFMDEVVEEAIDGAILKVLESNPEGETDKISSIYKVSDEREVQVDGENKIEGNVDGHHSDDVTSDALLLLSNVSDLDPKKGSSDMSNVSSWTDDDFFRVFCTSTKPSCG